MDVAPPKVSTPGSIVSNSPAWTQYETNADVIHPFLGRLQTRVRDQFTDLFINTDTPTVEDIQAIALVAAYSENAFVLVAMALRFAIQLGLPHVVDQLIAKSHARSGIVTADEQELYRLSRVWLGICNLELL